MNVVLFLRANKNFKTIVNHVFQLNLSVISALMIVR